MGRPKDPLYWQKWRAAHPEYRVREAARRTRRRASMTPEQRRIDRGKPKPVVRVEPLPLLMPHLQHGTSMSFWEDELRLDLAQEAHLATLEGRCPIEAVRAYLARERNWYNRMTYLFLDEINEGE
jgi:hypothetical protein